MPAGLPSVIVDTVITGRAVGTVCARSLEGAGAFLLPAGRPGMGEAASRPAVSVEPLPRSISEQRLGEMLVARGLLSPEDVMAALREQQTSDEFLGAVLVRNRRVTEEQVVQCLAEQHCVRYIRLRERMVDPLVIASVSKRCAIQHYLVPVERAARRLVVTTADPFDGDTPAAVRGETGCEIEICVSTGRDILDALKRYYGVGQMLHALDYPEYRLCDLSFARLVRARPGGMGSSEASAAPRSAPP